MSKISFKPADTGTATFTIEAPATNTNRTLTLPDEAGSVLTNGGALNVDPSAPVESAVIDSSGNVGIGTNSPSKDLDVSGEIRASSGILFGTDTATANALDDYEEGTWTPQVFDSSDNQASVGDESGRYTKIGNMVNLVINIDNINTTGLNSSDRVGVGNLPFVNRGGNDFTINAVRNSAIAVTDGPLIAQLFHSSGAVIQFLESNGQVFLNVGDLTSGSADLRFSLTYYT